MKASRPTASQQVSRARDRKKNRCKSKEAREQQDESSLVSRRRRQTAATRTGRTRSKNKQDEDASNNGKRRKQAARAQAAIWKYFLVAVGQGRNLQLDLRIILDFVWTSTGSATKNAKNAKQGHLRPASYKAKQRQAVPCTAGCDHKCPLVQVFLQTLRFCGLDAIQPCEHSTRSPSNYFWVAIAKLPNDFALLPFPAGREGWPTRMPRHELEAVLLSFGWHNQWMRITPFFWQPETHCSGEFHRFQARSITLKEQCFLLLLMSSTLSTFEKRPERIDNQLASPTMALPSQHFLAPKASSFPAPNGNVGP